jgi:hypothetical protein
MAFHILQQAYADRTIHPGDTIVEATSGNTGIAFAALGRALGHPKLEFGFRLEHRLFGLGIRHVGEGVAELLVGGLGSITGSLIGGFILGLIGSIVTYFDPGLSLIAYYVIFILLLLIRPTGIFGKVGFFCRSDAGKDEIAGAIGR